MGFAILQVMDTFLEQIDTNNLHHGYLIVGEREVVKSDLFGFLEKKLNVETQGNPDFLYFDFNTLAIDEARDIARMQERKAFGEEKGKDPNPSKKFFIIGTNIITEEAQNALLKVFEEPTPDTHFFILVSQNTFLPTFLSRLVLIQTNSKTGSQEKIIEKSLPEKLALVAKLAGDISDEKKIKQDAINLVNVIENELAKDGVEKNAYSLKGCQFARNALFSRGAMIKMILENLMLQI